MRLLTLVRPHVHAYPTLDTALWFLQLRWLAVVGQLLTLAVVRTSLHIQLPYSALLVLISLTVLSNCAYWYWLAQLQRRGWQGADRLPSGRMITALMFVDVADLTGLLYLSAGIANPFWFFYFVNIAVAAAAITPTWAWLLWGFTVACVFVLLSSQIQPIGLIEGSLRGQLEQARGWTLIKLGHLIAFVACSGIITYFITLLTGELRRREQVIQEAEQAKARNQQLEALATLAGGAAHELASPLSTIAVVAKEVGRSLDKLAAPPNVINDLQLIRSELDRCRKILDRMTTATGEAAGEILRAITIEDFFAETMLGVRGADRVRIQVDPQVKSRNLLPVQAAAQALRNLVQNALDASPDGTDVLLTAQTSDAQWLIQVQDKGQGMTEVVIKRLGEPFFTTKEPGKGMGLGVYLAMNVFKRLGGSLDFESRPGQGTTARVRLPIAQQRHPKNRS
jgi:two-component system sensor histidine kinase RegB